MKTATPTRTYYVNDGTKEHLVRTTHPSRAVSHVAEKSFTCRVASQDDLERLLPTTTIERIPSRKPEPVLALVPAEQKPAEPTGELAQVVEAQTAETPRILFADPQEMAGA